MIFVVIAVIVIYSRSIRGEFLFDDHAITDMNFKRWELAWQGKDNPSDPLSFSKALRYTFMEPRSLTHLGYLWTWQLFGFAPMAWHAVNIVLHLANTFLVFLLTATIRPDVSGPAAFLFAVHPHQVSAVSYISGRASLQVTFFAIAAIYIAWSAPLITGLPALYLSATFATRSKEDGYLWLLAVSFAFSLLYALFH